MGEQIAVVLDTNFIKAKGKQMEALLQELEEKYQVYVTQISVDERKEQTCRDFAMGFKSMEDFCSEFVFVMGKLSAPDKDEALSNLRCGMQSKYESRFSNRLIPLNASKELFETVLERANRKTPPFSTAENASDKGLKDTLIWLSVLEYFKTSGENEVIFVSDDNGFKKEIDFLCREFGEVTGKKVIIEGSNFYNSMNESKNFESELEQKNTKIIPPDINQMREKIQTVIAELCGISDFDYYGNPTWEKTFTLNALVDSVYMEVIFSHLKDDIMKNIFATSVPANEVLELDGRISNLIPIPMETLEKVSQLYEEIKANMPDFLPQFYSATANIINGNFKFELSSQYSTSDFAELDEEEDPPF
ncbi:MAG: PIN domain-containing protein [Oscillospiraceae bacterium]|nr:PIN domain-containing protein [Oscillospiraceae bacterium]